MARRSWATYSDAYGFQWWLDDLNYKGQPVETWVTSGYGGQYLFVIPSVDLVVASRAAATAPDRESPISTR